MAARWRGEVEEEDRGSACCRRSRAARSMASTSVSPLCSSPAPWRPGEAANSSVKRKQGGSARRRGDLTTDGSGLGVGVLGSGRSGFAAATRGVASSGGLPAGRTATWGTSGAMTAPSCTRRRRSSAAPLSSFSSSSPPGPFFFSPNQQLGQGHGALLSALSTPSPFPSLSGFAAQHEEKPHGLLDRGGGGLGGLPHGRRRSHREMRLGTICRAATRVWRCESGR
jgi:hypothetical protein